MVALSVGRLGSKSRTLCNLRFSLSAPLQGSALQIWRSLFQYPEIIPGEESQGAKADCPKLLPLSCGPGFGNHDVLSFTEKEMQKYARITNPEVVEAIYAEGHHLAFVLMGHTGNWEWFSGSSVFFRDIDIYELYKPMKGAMEEVMLKNREHLGTRCLDKNRAPVSIISLNRNREHRSSVVFLADQTPSLPNAHLFAPFLGQTTAMFTGAERLARKLNIPMIFLDVRRKKRGVYEATFSVISKTPQDLPWGEATRRYMLGVQRRIEHQPEIWLWSHKRWKHTPESAASLLGEDAVTVFTDEINHVGDGEKQ